MTGWEERSSLGLWWLEWAAEPLAPQPPEFLLPDEIKSLLSLSCCSLGILAIVAKTFLTDTFITLEKWELTPLVIPQNVMQIIKILNNLVCIKIEMIAEHSLGGPCVVD